MISNLMPNKNFGSEYGTIVLTVRGDAIEEIQEVAGVAPIRVSQQFVRHLCPPSGIYKIIMVNLDSFTYI